MNSEVITQANLLDTDLIVSTLSSPTKHIDRTILESFFHTKDINLEPQGVALVNPISGNQRFMKVDVREAAPINGKRTDILELAYSKENQKIIDRMAAVNKALSAFDKIMSIKKLEMDAFEEKNVTLIDPIAYTRTKVNDPTLPEADIYGKRLQEMSFVAGHDGSKTFIKDD